jgi:hypothetical protein
MQKTTSTCNIAVSTAGRLEAGFADIQKEYVTGNITIRRV